MGRLYRQIQNTPPVAHFWLRQHVFPVPRNPSCQPVENPRRPFTQCSKQKPNEVGGVEFTHGYIVHPSFFVVWTKEEGGDIGSLGHLSDL